MLAKRLKLYGLSIKEVKKIDLRDCYMQQRPNKPFDKLLLNEDGIVDSHMLNSPHFKIAKLYFKKGKKKTRQRYQSTHYYQMNRILGREGSPEKIINLTNSLRKGYLRKGYKEDYVVVLMEPFACSRYKRDVPDLVPEVWSGHHRIGILLAMEEFCVRVVVAEDSKPRSCFCVGKIHDCCVEKNL
tara:strand:- start:204 stop:758 length:555 start_codon:yes stop_codon:yes gene_type:complete